MELKRENASPKKKLSYKNDSKIASLWTQPTEKDVCYDLALWLQMENVEGVSTWSSSCKIILE